MDATNHSTRPTLEPLMVRLPKPLAQQVRRQAKQAQRTVSQELRKMVSDAIEREHGQDQRGSR